MARNGDGGSCGFCMKNSNGMVNLKDPGGNTVHTISWASSPTEGTSLVEDSSDPAADWVESGPCHRVKPIKEALLSVPYTTLVTSYQ